MNRLLLVIAMTFLLTSCYTETKKPDYKFMNKIKQQSLLDSSLMTIISLIPKKYYFGKIKNTDKIEGSFWIKNLGQVDFNIVSIKSNCECIKTTYLDTKTIHPNDSLIIKYQMITKNLKANFQNSIIAIGNCQNGNETYYFEGFFY